MHPCFASTVCMASTVDTSTVASEESLCRAKRLSLRQSPLASISRSSAGRRRRPPRAASHSSPLRASSSGQLGDIGCDPPGLVVREHVRLSRLAEGFNRAARERELWPGSRRARLASAVGLGSRRHKTPAAIVEHRALPAWRRGTVRRLRLLFHAFPRRMP